MIIAAAKVFTITTVTKNAACINGSLCYELRNVFIVTLVLKSEDYCTYSSESFCWGTIEVFIMALVPEIVDCDIPIPNVLIVAGAAKVCIVRVVAETIIVAVVSEIVDCATKEFQVPTY